MNNEPILAFGSPKLTCNYFYIYDEVLNIDKINSEKWFLLKEYKNLNEISIKDIVASVELYINPQGIFVKDINWFSGSEEYKNLYNQGLCKIRIAGTGNAEENFIIRNFILSYIFLTSYE